MYIEKSGLQESNTLTNVSCTYAGEGGKVLPGLTDYLKGLGIMAVMVNHFYNNYIGNTYEGYANGFIAVFFGLSGYGIYHSLNRLTYSIDTAKAALSYYLKRALRIYPLYFIVAGLYCLKDGFNLPIIFGLGSPRWFVSAILACYIVSFPLFILQKKWGTISFILFTAAGIALMNAFDSFAVSYMGFFSLFFPKY
jgi:peptidoglycan/LPS O-acetylase OafA/YrhL